MKNHFPSLLTLLASAPFLAFASTSNPSGSSAQAVAFSDSPAAHPAPANLVAPTPRVEPATGALESIPFAAITAMIQGASYSHHEGLSAIGDRANQAVTNQLATWKASGRIIPDSILNKLASARENFAQNLQQLALAPKETWETTKVDTLAAWDKVREACGAVLTQPPTGS